MSVLVSTNPAQNYVPLGEVTVSTLAKVTEATSRAHMAKKGWSSLSVKERIELLKPIVDAIFAAREDFVQLIMSETGKTLSLSRDEVDRGAVDWLMENAETILAPQKTCDKPGETHEIWYEPFGVTAVITPWNFPLGEALKSLISTLLAGNTVIFKISEECPLVGQKLGEVFTKHDFPIGVFNQVYGDGSVGEALTNQDVDLIVFTGSSAVGEKIYKKAADKFIKAHLEMGGSNPGIVFADADVKSAAQIMIDARFQHCGQICDSMKRLIVEAPIKDDLEAAMKEILESMTLGDPTKEETDFGPLVAERQVRLAEAQLQDALDKGARIVAQLEVDKSLKGAFFPPTILADITPDMRVWHEEVFAPILPIVSFQAETEAIALANDTIYGLGSRVITADMDRAKRVARQINAGNVEINQGSRWLPCNPFGGYKASGMGRTYGEAGLRELCQIKMVSAA